jgi:hypothetical protein
MEFEIQGNPQVIRGLGFQAGLVEDLNSMLDHHMNAD